MNQNQLERYSFLWSETRLVIAAIALLFRGMPLSVSYYMYMPIVIGFMRILRILGGLQSILWILWFISGLVSIYMVSLWLSRGRILFGENIFSDKIAFIVSVVSGINLGIAGLLNIIFLFGNTFIPVYDFILILRYTGLRSTNIGMSITSNHFVFVAVALIYLASAYHLHKRRNALGAKVF